MTITFTFDACGHSVTRPTDSALIAGKTCTTNGYCPTCQESIRQERRAQAGIARKLQLATLDRREYFIPTRNFVEDLKVGDLAPSTFGWKAIKEIAYRGDDVNGKAYVGYYVSTGPGSSISHSLKEGELDRSMAITSRHTSEELNTIERDLLASGVQEDNDEAEKVRLQGIMAKTNHLRTLAEFKNEVAE